MYINNVGTHVMVHPHMFSWHRCGVYGLSSVQVSIMSTLVQSQQHDLEQAINNFRDVVTSLDMTNTPNGDSIII